METTEGAASFTPEPPLAPLPRKKRSKLKKKLIYNFDGFNENTTESNSFSPKRAFFFFSSSSSEEELPNYAPAPARAPTPKNICSPSPARAPTSRPSRNICCSPDSTPPPNLLSRPASYSSMPGLVTPKPSPPPDFFSRPSSPLSIDLNQNNIALPSEVPTVPKRFSSSAFITIKPPARKPMNKNENHDTHETIYRTTSTTRTVTSPTAIVTTHHSTQTRTIIKPRS